MVLSNWKKVSQSRLTTIWEQIKPAKGKFREQVKVRTFDGKNWAVTTTIGSRAGEIIIKANLAKAKANDYAKSYMKKH